MESSGTSGKTSNSAHSKWAGILGTFIAVVTLTLPILAIAYYSSSDNSLQSLPQTNFVLPTK